MDSTITEPPSFNDSDYVPENEKRRGRGRPKGSVSKVKVPRRQSGNYSTRLIEDDTSLFEKIKSGKYPLQSIVDDWIESYRMNRETASFELIQFFIRAAGCKGVVTPRMRESMSNNQIIMELVEDFEEEYGSDYPLIMTGPQFKKFKNNFCEFVHVLIKQCQYSIIYDQYLMESLISWFISLSDSQVRAFRHTATLAAMKFMTALVDVALLLSVNLDNTLRQYEMEKCKPKDQRMDERLDALNARKNEMEDNTRDINLMLGYMFKSLFVHRYRDFVPEIRAVCIYEIGVWMKKFPNHFLDDSYLKYIGWTLNDKVADVRLKCLQALLPLYDRAEIAGKMELFIKKFKSRIVQMANDKVSEVAVQAIKLTIQIQRHHSDVLMDKDCESIYELVFVSNRGVAQAAGEFLSERYFQVDDSAEYRSRRGKRLSPHTPLVRDLVQFFIESEFHEHATYLVDSLIDVHPMMKDWECMTDLLLEEPGPEEESLDNKQETNLIEIMTCCVKQSVTGEPPICRETGTKRTNKEIKHLQEDKIKITEHFISVLPQLLNLYKTDPDKIVNLMTIPQYFELSLLTQCGDNLETLLRLINEIIDIHTDEEVLKTCAESYKYLYDDNYQFSRNVWLNKSQLVDTLVEKYKIASESYALNPTGQESGLVGLQIKKLALFNSCHDLNPWNIWKDLFEKWITPLTQDNAELPIEATKYAMLSCHYGLNWDLNLIHTKNTVITKPAFKKRLSSYINELRTIISSRASDILREDAYSIICDLLITFSVKLESLKLGALAYQPDQSLISELELFLLEKVFIEEYIFDDDGENAQNSNRRLEILHKKRNFLAGYCKLIGYNTIPMTAAVCVIKNYVKFFNDFGDIIKFTLSKLREINKVLCAKTMARALSSSFLDLRASAHNDPNAYTKQDASFTQLKDLAKRFSLSFGLDHRKNREAIAAFHREGIHFTFNTIENPDDPLGPPPNIPFLEIISEFSNKLLKQDKKIVLNYLDNYLQKALPGVRNDQWQQLLSYRSSLMQTNELDMPINRVPGGQSYSRGQNDDQDEEMNDEELESEVGSMTN